MPIIDITPNIKYVDDGYIRPPIKSCIPEELQRQVFIIPMPEIIKEGSESQKQDEIIKRINNAVSQYTEEDKTVTSQMKKYFARTIIKEEY